jgi:hypothetical protein
MAQRIDAMEAAVAADGGTRCGGGGRDGRWWHLARRRRLRPSDRGALPRWSQLAGLPRRYGSGTAMRKERADAAEELGDEDGGMALRLGIVDPLPQQHGANLCGPGRAAWAGASSAGGSARHLGSEAHVREQAARVE